MNRSLRKRLFLWLSVAIVVMGAATAGITFQLNFEDANELQDTQLQQVAAALATQATTPPAATLRTRDPEQAETRFVIRALGSHDVDPDPWLDVDLPASLQPGLQSLKPSRVQWRVMVARNAGGQWFGVAQRQRVRDEAARDSAVTALVPTLMLVPLLLLIVHLLLRQGFAPLAALTRELDAGDGHRLRPLATADVPAEALPLVLALNGLLTRLGGMLEQQRRMVADAAHELRTPVAAARVQADNLGHVDLPPDARARLESLQLGLDRISGLVEQLLKYARVQGAAPVVDEPIALEAIVRSAIEQTLPLAEARWIDLGCIRLDRARVRGDASHANALVRNAIDNAVRYTPACGWVDVSLVVEDDVAIVAVEDTGPGIPVDLRERVFEPFFRILGSDQDGNGLGLAIVRSAALALGGEVELAGRLDGKPGLRFTYRQKVA